MVCEHCKKNDATVHFTKIINGEKTEFNLCNECAKEYKGQFSFGIEPNFSIHQFLTNLFNDTLNVVQEQNVRSEPVCPVCNLSYSNFSSTGRLGCSNCYEFYERNIDKLLKRIHGSTRHTGKVPKKSGGQIRLKKQIETLKLQLQRLVKEEQFEKAAEVRDQIKSLEKELHARG